MSFISSCSMLNIFPSYPQNIHEKKNLNPSNIHENKLWTNQNTHKKKTQTCKISTRKNFRLTKYPLQDFGSTKYPQEKNSDSLNTREKNTHEKTFLTHKTRDGTRLMKVSTFFSIYQKQKLLLILFRM